MVETLKANRRQFIAGSAAIIGTTALSGNVTAQNTPAAIARIVAVEHKDALISPTQTNDEIVPLMIEAALKAFTGAKSGAEALSKYFQPTQKIAIKINTLGSPYSAVNPITAMTLAKLLQEMGVPADNIRIFDQYQSRMRKAGYRMRRRKGEVWVTNHRGRNRKEQLYEHKGHRVRFHWANEIVWADAVLNVCVPKDHDLTGVTGSLKNMAMGVVKPTPQRYANKKNPGHYTVVPRFHKNNCDPAIPWLYSQPMIKDKVKLIVCDALRVLYHRGPQDHPRYRELYNQIMVTTDPVALDTTILDLVNRIRVNKGMKKVEDDPWFRGKARPPNYLKTAAKMGLGVGDLSRIKIEKTTLA